MTRRVRWTCAALLVLVGATLVQAQSDPAPSSDPIRARVFEVHYRSVADAADLVLDLLSDAKRSYLEVPGASEESWRALLGNDTLKPVIDADPALHRLVAAESRG